MKKITYLIIIIATLLSSCEKIIDISISDKSRKIVVNAILNPDSLVSVQLTQSKSVLEDNSLIFLEDAEVKLFEADQYVGTLEYLGFAKYGLPDFYPQREISYRIEVNHPVLTSVEPEITLPSSVPILDVGVAMSFDDYGNDNYKLIIKISDPPGVDNFYALSIAVTSRVFDWESGELTDSTETDLLYFQEISDGDPPVGGGLVNQNLNYFIDNMLFVSDNLFDGKDHEFSLVIEYLMISPGVDSVMMDIRLDHIDPSYYHYAVSKQKYYHAHGNPFSEPVQVYSNIENGFGLLSAYSRTSRQYNIKISGTK